MCSDFNLQHFAVIESQMPLYSQSASACTLPVVMHAWTLKSQQTKPCSWWWTVMRAGSHRQAGPDLRAVLVAPGSTLSKRMLMLSHFHLYGEQRSSGVMGRRNGPSGLRDDDDDDDKSYFKFKLIENINSPLYPLWRNHLYNFMA